MQSVSTPEIVVPEFASWFSFTTISTIEKNALPEFFKGSNASKTPKIYKAYRNFMISNYWNAPKIYLSFTDCRKSLSGDAAGILRIHNFLEHWGLINYQSEFCLPKSRRAPNKHCLNVLIETPTQHPRDSPSVCKMKRKRKQQFNCLKCGQLPNKCCRLKKYDENFNIDEGNTPKKPKNDLNDSWSVAENFRFLEAMETFQNDWQKIAEHVQTKNEKECILQYLQMPMEESLIFEEKWDNENLKKVLTFFETIVNSITLDVRIKATIEDIKSCISFPPCVDSNILCEESYAASVESSSGLQNNLTEEAVSDEIHAPDTNFNNLLNNNLTKDENSILPSEINDRMLIASLYSFGIHYRNDYPQASLPESDYDQNDEVSLVIDENASSIQYEMSTLDLGAETIVDIGNKENESDAILEDLLSIEQSSAKEYQHYLIPLNTFNENYDENSHELPEVRSRPSAFLDYDNLRNSLMKLLYSFMHQVLSKTDLKVHHLKQMNSILKAEAAELNRKRVEVENKEKEVVKYKKDFIRRTGNVIHYISDNFLSTNQ